MLRRNRIGNRLSPLASVQHQVAQGDLLRRQIAPCVSRLLAVNIKHVMKHARPGRSGGGAQPLPFTIRAKSLCLNGNDHRGLRLLPGHDATRSAISVHRPPVFLHRRFNKLALLSHFHVRLPSAGVRLEGSVEGTAQGRNPTQTPQFKLYSLSLSLTENREWKGGRENRVTPHENTTSSLTWEVMQISLPSLQIDVKHLKRRYFLPSTPPKWTVPPPFHMEGTGCAFLRATNGNKSTITASERNVSPVWRRLETAVFRP